MTVPEQDRIEALLGLDHRPGFAESAPEPAADAIGAVAAIAYAHEACSAVVTVYVFDDYQEAAAAAQEMTEYPEAVVESTVNGDLFLWATADADDEVGVAAIDGLAGEFAGRE